MKKLSFILSLLCLSCSMSFGQILQWTKTISAPILGARLSGNIYPMSKTSSSVAVYMIWYNEAEKSGTQQIIWFGSRGSVILSELYNYDENDLQSFYGISSSRLVLRRDRRNIVDGVVTSTVTSYITYTRKGSVVTKTEIDGMPMHNLIRDEAGFFKFEKGEGDTWILKRYIF